MDKYNLTEPEKDCLRCMVFASYLFGNQISLDQIKLAGEELNRIACLGSIDALCMYDFVWRIGDDYVLDKDIINANKEALLVRDETKFMELLKLEEAKHSDEKIKIESFCEEVLKTMEEVLV